MWARQARRQLTYVAHCPFETMLHFVATHTLDDLMSISGATTYLPVCRSWPIVKPVADSRIGIAIVFLIQRIQLGLVPSPILSTFNKIVAWSWLMPSPKSTSCVTSCATGWYTIVIPFKRRFRDQCQHSEGMERTLRRLFGIVSGRKEIQIASSGDNRHLHAEPCLHLSKQCKHHRRVGF